MRLLQMEGIITGFVATGLTCVLVIVGLGELTANPYSHSGTPIPTQSK